jgi:hypothetical protein
MFEGVIAKLTTFAVYLPVRGGNAGAQSLAVVMRGLVVKREIPKGKAWRLTMKETGIGTVNGALLGLVTAAIAWAWHGNPFLGVVIGLGILVNLSVSGLSGSAIPLVMKKGRPGSGPVFQYHSHHHHRCRRIPGFSGVCRPVSKPSDIARAPSRERSSNRRRS